MSDAVEKKKNEGPWFPVAVMALSVVGLCMPPLLLVTLSLGVYGFLRARKDPAWAPRKQVTQMTMAVSGAGIVVFLGIGLPQFKRIMARSQQYQCMDTLKQLSEAQRRLYEKEKRYSTSLAELQPLAQRSAVLVRLAPEGPLWTQGTLEREHVGAGVDEQAHPTLSTKQLDAALPKLTLAELGIRGECPACSVTMVCTTEIDGDPTTSLWTVSTIERKGSRGEVIPAGIPWLERDDLTE
ncbi:MAG: hypothetical protein ACOZQL_31395 [Myxococcota bacterium]